MNQPQRLAPRHPIRVVSRRTGLKATLIRAWERRHGVIEPHRSRGNHRFYSDADIERLILLRQATEQGRGIGQVAKLDNEALRQLIAEDAQAVAQAPAAAGQTTPGGLRSVDRFDTSPRVRACIEATTRLDAGELAFLLERSTVELGPRVTLTNVVAPFMQEIGELWQRARLRPMHEHLACSVVRSVVDDLIRTQQLETAAPKLVVTTPSGQRHEMGALLAAALAALEGWRVTYLGSDLPAEDIVAAAGEVGAQAVALSLVYPADDPQLGQQLLRLRRQLTPQTAILAGGQAVSSYRSYLEEAQATVVSDVRHLKELLDHLRQSGSAPGIAMPIHGTSSSRPSEEDTGEADEEGLMLTQPQILVSHRARRRYQIDADRFSNEGGLLLGDIQAVRRLTEAINARRRDHDGGHSVPVRAGQLHALGLIQELDLRWLHGYRLELNPSVFRHALEWLERTHGAGTVSRALRQFAEFYPGTRQNGYRGNLLEKMLLVWLANDNPATEPLRELFDDHELDQATGYRELLASLDGFFQHQPPWGPEAQSILDLLRKPVREHPRSLAGQLEVMLRIEERFSTGVVGRVLRALDVLREEERPSFAGPGPASPVMMEREGALVAPAERPWMAELVLIAKNVHVWLHQASRIHARPIERLDQIPDAELDRLAAWGVSGLWLIGIWRRSPASRRIKELAGLPDALGSAYAVDDYRVAEELGGDAALAELETRARRRGLRLACDFVPNHTGLDSRWMVEHPERFLALERCPFPSYTFTGEDLSRDSRMSIYLEDHYEDQSDAAVVFKRVDRRNGEVRYVYHGNDGTGLPWNDTAQLDYLDPEVREAVIANLVELAQRFPVIRLDAAMTLVKQHFQRLWYPEPGQGGAIPSRAEHGLSGEEFDRRMPEELWRQVMERLAAEAPETLLIAEGFWQMESYFVRELGVHRVYHSAFMHMLRDEQNGELRASLKSALELDRRILGRWVNYLTTPDERTAAEQLGKGDKYFALATLWATLPGLPLLGHGQFEGLVEPYGMDSRRVQYSEAPDRELIARHERQIVPLLKSRELFAGTESFRLYSFMGTRADGRAGRTFDDVYAFSNRAGGRRVLVVVHNRRTSVRGRIYASVPFREVERDVLVQENLGEALGLEAGGELYCVFREAGRDLHYVHPCRELCENGLEIELGPYDHRVFVGFRQVRDDDSGRWRRLAEELAGRGVANLEDLLAAGDAP